MNSAQSQGYAALSQAINSQQQNDRNMAYLEKLATKKKQEDQERQEAQLAEQQYYQYLNQQAEGLLAGDREKINKRALKMQAAIKEQIANYGGDRRQFFNNGGHSLLSGYVNKIAQSEEMQIYKENKQNLVRIMDAQQKGLGGQIMQRDLDSLRNYQETGQGKITYGGLLNTIEMPDSNNYALGSDIPIDDIINNKANRLKILANFRMEYGRDPQAGEDGQPGELEAYASYRYGGKGSNRDHINHAMRMQQLEAAKKQSATPGKTEKPNQRLVVAYQKVASEMPTATVSELFDSKENYWKKHNSEFARRMGMRSWNHTSQRMDLNPIGWNAGEWQWLGRMINPSVRLAHSGEIFSTAKNKIASIALGGQVDENGYIELEPGEDFYDMTGFQRAGDERLEPGEYKSKYKVLGISTAMKGTTEDGEQQLLVEILDDGKVDAEATKEHAQMVRNSTATPTTVVAIKHPDGHIFYKELGLEGQEQAAAYDDALGSAGDLTPITTAQQQQAELDRINDSMTAQEKQRLEQLLVMTDQQLEGDPYFSIEVNNFTDPQTGQNRSGIMKAFYAAVGATNESLSAKQAAGQNFFTYLLTRTGGQEAVDMFKTFGNSLSDEQLIRQYEAIANRNATQAQAASNSQFANQWINALRNYHQLNQ